MSLISNFCNFCNFCKWRRHLGAVMRRDSTAKTLFAEAKKRGLAVPGHLTVFDVKYYNQRRGVWI